MALRYYAALGPGEDAALVRHLDSCPACARGWDSLRQTLDAADPATVFPLEAGVDWQEFKRTTVVRASAAGHERRRTDREPLHVGLPRSWPVAIAAAARLPALAAAVVVTVVLLNAWLRPAGPRVARVPPFPGTSGGSAPLASLLESAHAMEDRLARQGAARYLSDSRSLLLNLVGAAAPCRKTDGQYDIALEKEKSRQLLRRQNLYEGDLQGLEDQRLATLVRQLEAVLMEVTALDDCASARQIHDLREQIENRQFLLRIDLITREMQRRADVV